MPECEAERRNQRALYLLENEWGCGRIDVPEMQRLLRGPACECKPEPTENQESTTRSSN